MADHPLGAEERALWARVIATVTPMAGKRTAVPVAVPPVRAATAPGPVKTALVVPVPRPSSGTVTKAAANTLDGSWDRRLSRGLVAPDVAVDLHGYTLGSAYAALDDGLQHAIRSGARVMLLVTGKPPRGDGSGRGAIRGAVGDWLAASRHAGDIAAVRTAHPRHGGAGALYIILRRARPTKT